MWTLSLSLMGASSPWCDPKSWCCPHWDEESIGTREWSADAYFVVSHMISESCPLRCSERPESIMKNKNGKFRESFRPRLKFGESFWHGKLLLRFICTNWNDESLIIIWLFSFWSTILLRGKICVDKFGPIWTKKGFRFMDTSLKRFIYANQRAF